MNYIKT